jgi:hypothetical protein
MPPNAPKGTSAVNSTLRLAASYTAVPAMETSSDVPNCWSVPAWRTVSIPPVTPPATGSAKTIVTCEIRPGNMADPGGGSRDANWGGIASSSKGTITGALQGNVEEGKILETPTINALRSALGSVNGPGSLDDLVFKSLKYSAKIDKGRLVLNQVEGALGKDLMQLAGSAGFDHSLNLDLLLKLAPGRVQSSTALGQFANYARDEQGRLPIRVAITGTVTSPKVSIKATSTVEAAGRGLAKEIFENLMGKTRPDTTRADTTKATRADTSRADTSHAARKPAHADTTIADPLKKAQEALEKLFKK